MTNMIEPEWWQCMFCRLGVQGRDLVDHMREYHKIKFIDNHELFDYALKLKVSS